MSSLPRSRRSVTQWGKTSLLVGEPSDHLEDWEGVYYTADI
jgi:hypothetical protein